MWLGIYIESSIDLLHSLKSVFLVTSVFQKLEGMISSQVHCVQFHLNICKVIQDFKGFN